MKDQVDDLRTRHIKAAYLHAGLTRSEAMNVLDNVLHSHYKLLYVAPERLSNKTFLQRLPVLNVSFVVVDECHCISQWGFDFRPDYLRIKDFRQLLPEDTPLLALTASATPRVVEHVQQLLAFREGHQLFKRSFYRKNLSYVVRQTGNKLREALHILSRVQGSALVYLQNRKKTKEWAEFLNEQGLSADYFHAGLPPEVKARKQEAWQNNQVRIMVCTNAFGMGINKPDVRLVLHPTPPLSPESYYQEAGRAGRDNLRAFAVLLYKPGTDEGLLARRLQIKYPEKEVVRRIYDALGNYLQIGEYLGEGTLQEFDIFRFCANFRFAVHQVQSALNLLSMCGYLEYLEEHELPSSVRFLVSRNELYTLFTDTEVVYDDVVEYLLRHYPGLFTEAVYINEKQMANALNISLEQLYLVMKNMRRWHIIEYIPGKRSNYIYYRQQRLPSRQIRIPKILYEERLKADEARMNTMVEYLQLYDQCRVQLLVEYFGEEEPLPCGYCDVCLAHKGHTLTYKKIEELEEYLLQHPSATEEQLLVALPTLTPKQLAKALHFLRREHRLPS